jgi:hypothetical protein
MQNAFCENGFEPTLLSEIPLFSQYFKSYVLVRGSCLKFNQTVIWVLHTLKIVLRGLLLIVQIRVKYIEFVSLNCLNRLNISFTMLQFRILIRYSDSINILRFSISKTTLGFSWKPLIKFLLIRLHSFVLLKFHDLLRNKIICLIRLIDEVFWKKVMIFRQW